MSNYKYKDYGVIRDLKSDIPYHTYDIVDLFKEKNKQIKELKEENQKLKQAQKQVAIEELEGLQVQCQFSITFADYKQEQRLYDYINDRIKELKGSDVHA